jgi:hypothetical protein
MVSWNKSIGFVWNAILCSGIDIEWADPSGKITPYVLQPKSSMGPGNLSADMPTQHGGSGTNTGTVETGLNKSI